MNINMLTLLLYCFVQAMWAVRIVPLWYSIWLTSAQRWSSESTFNSDATSIRTVHIMLNEIFLCLLDPFLLLQVPHIFSLPHFNFLDGVGHNTDLRGKWLFERLPSRFRWTWWTIFSHEILSYSRAISTRRKDLWNWGWNSRGEKTQYEPRLNDSIV